ncbi:glycoside hydrolase family 31 protein [Amantichitinum ursilacus]|uniref:Alpha-xylosidase n=1 Tax=Amantichitinum ursilacus TaxID=857265 RepID=A0A0N0GPC5_9NEIS|nr:TIM-barrel domain-containing protein [Amantichitinum ursilacus]KPC53354.1 Alpha-xylosidase [Amantichitinum ursilacus]
MPQAAYPPVFALQTRQGALLTLRSADHEHLAHIFVLENDILRVLVLPGAQLKQPHSWAIAPGLAEVPTAGRDRFDLRGFTLPDYQIRHLPGQLVVETCQLRLTITLVGLRCHWQNYLNGAWHDVAADRACQSLNWGSWDQRVYHYLQHDERQMYFGLGERSGPSNRAGQRYRMQGVDASGYDASNTDPLYKHIPFYLAWHCDSAAPVGFFYDTLADCTFDMGREVDACYGPSRSFIAEHGDLDYYVFGGDSLLHIVQRYTWLTGRPALMPRWALGCSSAAVRELAAADTQRRVDEFIANRAQHDMLCDVVHLISRQRDAAHGHAPTDPVAPEDTQRWLRRAQDQGVHLIAGITPGLLHNHPRFTEAAAQGLFIKGYDGKPQRLPLRGGSGAYLDFTQPATVRWWQAVLKTTLLDAGINALRLDDAEYDIRNADAIAYQAGQRVAASEIKPLQPLLSAQASCKALQTSYPTQRPLLTSRAGFAGMQRYLQTWSGEPRAGWDTLRFNIKMAWGLALCGVSNTGHALAGNAPAPSERELYLRTLQAHLLLPRLGFQPCTDAGSPLAAPWHDAGLVAPLRMLLQLRERLLPHLYHLLWRAHAKFEPVVRPTLLNFPDDADCFADNDDWMLGADLLIAPVVQPGATTRAVYLPQGCGWFDGYRGSYYPGGQTVTVSAQITDPPVLMVRAGAIIALNTATQYGDERADTRGFALYPPSGEGQYCGECFDDDGISPLSLAAGAAHLWRLKLDCRDDALKLTLTSPDRFRSHEVVTLYLPEQETRPLRAPGWHVAPGEPSAPSRSLLLVRNNAAPP